MQSEPLDLSITSKFRINTEQTPQETYNPINYINKSLLSLYQSNIRRPYHTGRSSFRNPSLKNVLPCEICLKTFDRPSLLKRHMRTHTGEKPHVCPVCSKGFSTSSSLNTHKRIHTGEKPHKCGECGKCFTASSNLYYHRMTHTKNKPHKCALCPRSFPTPGDLRAHGPAHGGAWPHTCPICRRGFAKLTNLRHHMRLHQDSIPGIFFGAHQGRDLTSIIRTLHQMKDSTFCNS